MIIDEFNPSENDFVGEIKRQMYNFINSCESINIEQKRALQNELGSNWFDERFTGEVFIETAIDRGYTKWSSQQNNYKELWEKIAIENAKINNEPHVVANQVISEYKKQFKLEL